MTAFGLPRDGPSCYHPSRFPHASASDREVNDESSEEGAHLSGHRETAVPRGRIFRGTISLPPLAPHMRHWIPGRVVV